MTQRPVVTMAIALGLVCDAATGFNETRQLDPQDRNGNWSLGFAYTWQDSIYAGESYRTDFMPSFVYTGETFFLDTTDFGWHAIDNARWQLDIFGSYFIQGYNDHTFFSDTGEVRDEDDPLKGMERKNALEGGLELTRKTRVGRLGLQLRHDIDGVHNGSEYRARWAKVYRHGPWQLEPWAEFRYLSSEKADYYFGVREEEATDTREAYRVSGTTAWGVGLGARYTAWDQHHFTANLGYRSYSDEIVDSPIVTEDAVASVNVAYRYEFNDLRVPKRGEDFNFFTNNASPTSLRGAYGCTTETKFNEILRGNVNCDGGGGTRLASVFGGRQITETLFTLPIEGWLIGGIAYRDENNRQDDFLEAVLAYKAIFRRFPWSDKVETRIGFAEGLSYAGSVPAIEKQKAEEKNRRTSHLINYLEFSVDVSVGDVLGADDLRNLFFGFYVHHRSGIFASANIYGNVYGGSNVNALYLEWEFGR
ncbi:MAG: MipA/OmpV family protein [Pseudomonadota bacterium]